MSTFTQVRRTRLAALAAAAAVALTTAPVVLNPAHAETTGQASAKVHTLLAKVHRLQVKAKAAEKRYAASLTAVADSVNVAITADQDSLQTSNRARAKRAALQDQVSTLYESGGSLTAAASFFTSGSLTELSARSEMASRAVSAQVESVDSAQAQARTAVAASRLAARQADTQIATGRTVAVAASNVTALLRGQAALLKSANHKLAAVRAAAAALAAETFTFSTITTSGLTNLHILPPSAEYLHLYQAAAPTCPGLSWTVLAAIGQVESGHGRDVATSSAGAMGPMQFEPATFRAYAVDGDHDGKTNIMDPADAIFTAAHYLCANGAGRGPGALSNAILHYNHAVWYVQMVLKLAGEYATAYPSP